MMIRLWRRVRWLLSGGPSRLRAARLRRSGDVLGAIPERFGHRGAALIIMQSITAIPHDLDARMRLYRQITRGNGR